MPLSRIQSKLGRQLAGFGLSFARLGRKRASKRPHVVRMNALITMLNGVTRDSTKRVVFTKKYPQRNCNEKLSLVLSESDVSLVKSRP